MRCPSCESNNPDAAQYCAACGMALASTCPHCQADLTPGARFCISCGRPVSRPDEAAAADDTREAEAIPLSERRRISVLFVDLVELHGAWRRRWTRRRSGRYRRDTSRWHDPSWPPMAARSRSSSAMPSWPSGARHSRTRMTRNAPCAPLWRSCTRWTAWAERHPVGPSTGVRPSRPGRQRSPSGQWARAWSPATSSTWRRACRAAHRPAAFWST